MSIELQKRLYEAEATPPPQVWSNLSVLLDEINADNKVASRVEAIEINPPDNVWENINASFEETTFPAVKKQVLVISIIKRLAVAAAIIGVIATGWILVNKKKRSSEIVSTHQVKENTVVKPETPVQKETTVENENPATKQSLTVNDTKSVSPLITQTSSSKKYQQQKLSGQPLALSLSQISAVKEETTGKKIFDQPIDDLSMIAANDNYFTMVNSNGRLVKIPAHLAHLAPRLQDKPITEDYYEILFGEGTYWKDKLSEWRKTLADSPASAGDMFSNAVELLKSVQNN